MWSDVKDYITNMPHWKKWLWYSSIIAGSLLMLAFLVWALSIHGTVGLYKVNGFFRILFILFAIYTVALPLLAALDVFINSRKQKDRIHLPSSSIWVIALVGIVIPCVLFTYLVPAPSQRVGDKQVQLLMTDGTGKYDIPDMAVVFWTLTPSQNTLKWGTGNADNLVHEDKPSQQHVFMLRELQPWYSLNDAAPVHFSTPPGAGQPIHFAVGSDSHFGATASRNDLTLKMLQQIADPAHGYQMFFFLGDMVELGFKDSHWQEAIEAFSATTSTIPFRPVIGNHDTLFGGLQLYRDYLYPDTMPVQTGTPLWQRIDINNTHFLLLDLEWSDEAYTPQQADWLEKQLSTIPQSDWCIVMSHTFYYSSGGYWGLWDWYDNQDTISRLVPLFEKYDVDLVFSGHNHHLELLQNNNVTYSICAAFGGHPDPERSYTSPASIWYLQGQAAFMDVTILPDSAKLVFRDPDNNELKSITVSP